MFDRSAAQRAASGMLNAAPRIEGGTGAELALSVKDLVEAIVTAGDPDALQVPAYDPVLAPEARYRLEQPTEVGQRGRTISAVARTGVVELNVYAESGTPMIVGLVSPEAAWQLGLAVCSASQESRRLHAEVQA